MSVLIGLLLVAAFIGIWVYYSSVAEKTRLQNLIQCLYQIEKYPNSPSGYDKFMALWQQSSFIKPQTFLAGDYYDRILKICNTNSHNILSWHLLKAVIIRFLLAFNEYQISETFTVLIKSIENEFKNTPVKTLILEIIILFIRDNESQIQFLNYWLSKTFVRLPKTDPNLYLINLPVKISNLRVYENSCNVDFSLIYFKIHKGEFSMGDTNISYNLKELFDIFIQAIKGEDSIICINFSSRKVFVYSSENYRVAEFRHLISLYKEFMNIDSDIQNLNNEIKKVESLAQVIQNSDAHQHQLVIYRKGLRILEESRLKAIGIREEYFQFLKERTLNLYVDDLEPDMFKVENQKINWEVKHQHFKEDYDFFKTMIQEYNKLKNG